MLALPEKGKGEKKMLVENPVKITETQIKKMAKLARGRITTIYLHWTAGHYGQVFDDYHLCIDQDGTVYATCDDFCERKSHTWMRNGGTIGIALSVLRLRRHMRTAYRHLRQSGVERSGAGRLPGSL